MITIVSLTTKNTYQIDPQRGGENAMACPECSKDRKKKNAKSFSWNNEKMTGKCMHCDASFVLYRKIEEKKEYKTPTWANKTSLDDKAVKWFTGRMISQETLNKMKIYSDVEFIPQANEKRNVICFPFFDNGELINVKYRDGAKNFKLFSGAKLIPYNIDSIRGKNECVIVEGEIDALSYITCGVENVVSVPNGANKNLTYLDDYIELFDGMEKIYIATDNDVKGIELRDELIRRFGSERCLIVNFKDVKDANEYFIRYGGLELKNTISNAIEIPVDGVVNLSNYYDDIQTLFLNGLESGMKSYSIFDEACTWEFGRLCIITGIPSHGKSEWLDFILVRLNIEQQIKVAYFSPENYPVKFHYSKLASKITGKAFNANSMDINEFESSFEYIKDNFFFIDPEDGMDMDNILAKAKYLIKKRGIKALVIDPYNKIEHLKKSGENETEYISRFLDKLIMFARRNNILIFLVAHPRKMGKDAAGNFEVPSLYDINGSANFYNKADYGITVYRDKCADMVYIHFLKIKFKHLGDGGTIACKYNFKNGRYEHETSDFNTWDDRSYLICNNNNAIKSNDLFYSGSFCQEVDVPF